jgi:hypothetical protein
MIVNTGKTAIAGMIASTSGEHPFTYIAIGTDDTAPTINDTELGNELIRTSSTYTQYSQSGTFVLTVTFLAGSGTGSITEAGTFNSSYGGTMLARQTFSALNKTNGTSLSFDWTYTI